MSSFCSADITAATIAIDPTRRCSADDHADIKAEITKRHDEAVKRLQDWIAQVSIAAGEPRISGRRGVHGEARARCGISAGDGDQHRWQAGRVRDARCRRAENGRALFHVRCETVRSSGVVVAADRSADRGQTAAGQSDDRSRRGESEGTGSGVPRGAARDSRRGKEDAGEPGDGGRRRGGDRFAAHPAAR